MESCQAAWTNTNPNGKDNEEFLRNQQVWWMSFQGIVGWVQCQPYPQLSLMFGHEIPKI